jgi:hypothetical protein
MNKAAGELSFSDFTEDEETFLENLARPMWKEDAKRISRIWKNFSDAYAEYPLSNDMQYYGPFHAGLAWPLSADVCLRPLGRTWKPEDPPSGDTIGECLENHTIEEAVLLGSRMAKGVRVLDASGRDELDLLCEKWRGNKERMRDLGVMKALEYHFLSGSNILGFYLDRAKALYASRVLGDVKTASAALERMDAAVAREEELTRKILPVAKDDSRIGFHSEAEAHQYHPAKLEWRLGELARTRKRILEIRSAVNAGMKYPESEFERNAPACEIGGDWTAIGDVGKFKIRMEDNGDYTFDLELKRGAGLEMCTLDAAGVSWYRIVNISASGSVEVIDNWNRVSPAHEIAASSHVVEGDVMKITFTLASAAWAARDDRRPQWLQFHRGREVLWPVVPMDERYSRARLNIGFYHAYQFGRIIVR